MATSCFKTLFLKQEEADPGPARVALAAPAHAVLSHGRVGRTAAGLRVAARAAGRLLVARAAAPGAGRRQPREVQLVLHYNVNVNTALLYSYVSWSFAARK